MDPRAFRVGLPPVTLLLACLLIAPAAVATPSPISQPAVAGDARSAFSPSSTPDVRAVAPPAVSSVDGAWQEWNLLQVSNALAFHDPVHDQLISIGGRAENWALPLAGPLAWQALPAMRPPNLTGLHSPALDPATGLVYFLADGATSLEVRTLDPQTGKIWVVPVSGTPPLSIITALVFDAAGQRLIVIEGDFFPSPPDVWVLKLLPTPSWSHWTPSGTPSAIRFPTATLDPVRRRVLIFTFGSLPGAPEIQAITLDGSPEWLHFPTNGLPSGAYSNPVAYDTASDRMWTLDTTGEPFSLSLETNQWSPVPTAGPGPTPRGAAGIVFDPGRHQLLVNGGQAAYDTHSDAWALSVDGTPAWTQLVPDAIRPPVRDGASDGYDASRHRMIMFGGADAQRRYSNDTWALDLGVPPTWAPIVTQGPTPPGRTCHVSTWDDAHDRLVVYGGFNGSPLGDVWALSFAGGAPTWTQVTPAGPAPPERFLSQMVYDSARDRFLILLGQGQQYLSDVWELRLSPTPSWRLLAPTGVPPSARSSQMCVYDPGQSRVVMFGGETSTGYVNDVWALNLDGEDGAWAMLPVPPGPTPRKLGLLRLDARRDRLILFGGNGLKHGYLFPPNLDDTWALDLSGSGTWRPLFPSGFIPRPRAMTNGACDPGHDRLVLACGGDLGGNVWNDLWTLNFVDAPTPTQLDLANREVTADRVRLVWAGGEPGMRATVYRRETGAEWWSLADLLADGEGYVTLEDRDVTPGVTLEYRLGVMTSQGEAYYGATRVAIPLRLLSLTARAEEGRALFTVELPSGDPATLALFDVAGRSVWSRAVGHLGAGSHEVSAGDAALPAALYFARLTQGQASRFARFAIVR